MVLFIMLHKVVLTFRSVDETLICDHSNESYCFHVVLVITPLVCDHFKWKLFSSTFKLRTLVTSFKYNVL